MNERTKISVVVITYNQQETIAQTLDSILMQKGDFDIELVIGEDCSTDNTYGICHDYAERYPDIVKLLPNTHNLGIMANFARVMRSCTGDYITGCAGDDYWCDEHKIEKQLHFLESHPDYGVVTTEGYKLYTRRGKLIPGLTPCYTPVDGNIKPFYFSTSYRGGVYVVPLSQMYKASLLQYIDFDEFLRRKLPVEDYPMQAIWSQYTKFGHIQDRTCVYRVHSDSATYISFDNPQYMDYYRGLAEIRRYLNELFPEDACFSETQLQEQLFYKEFLLYLHQCDYKKAMRLIASIPAIIANSAKVRQAKRFTKTRLHFITAHYIKEYNYKKDINQRT